MSAAMSLPHEIETALGAVAFLAQAKKYDETTFTAENQAFFAELRSTLIAAGVDVERLVDKMLNHEVIEIEELKISNRSN